MKRFESGVVYQPITLTPDQTLADAKLLMDRYNITGFPVVDQSGRVVGIVTNRDMRFASDDKTPVSVMMTSDNLALLREPVDREAAISLMKARRTKGESSMPMSFMADPSGFQWWAASAFAIFPRLTVARGTGCGRCSNQRRTSSSTHRPCM